MRPEIEHVMSAVARRAREGMAARSPDKVLEVVGHAVRLAESAYFRLRIEVGPGPPIACRAGCAHCCSSAVAVAPPEAIRIAGHLRATRSDEELAELRRRIAKLTTQTAGMTWARRTRVRKPCLFLDDGGRCSIYQVRPLTCRAFTSVDPAYCQDVEHTFTPDESDVLQYDTQRAGLAGILAAIAEAQGLARGEEALVELQGAVGIALEDPAALARWLAGEPVFAAVATVVVKVHGTLDR